jgi:hypothetical protein
MISIGNNNKNKTINLKKILPVPPTSFAPGTADLHNTKSLLYRTCVW